MANRIPVATLDPCRDETARQAAYSRVSWPVNLAPASVSYQSHGHLLIVGNEYEARLAARELLRGGELASLTLAITAPVPENAALEEAAEAFDTTAHLSCFHTCRLHLEGYLGAFRAVLMEEGEYHDLARASIGRDAFDLVLDLGETPQLVLELLPPGYHAVRRGDPGYHEALATLAESVGEFEKPRYFHIDHALCAHDGRGKTGCTRCLDVCPADAIESVTPRIESHIEIDPYRCHGAGSCTSACPTGAIQYLLPQPQRQLDYVARLLEAYRQAGGEAPIVRFAEQHWLESETSAPAAQVLDVPLEELGAAGQEHWLAALADGASEVRIQRHPALPSSLAVLIGDQLEQTRTMLVALGHAPERIAVIDESDAPRDAPANLAPLRPRETLSLAPGATKRDRLNSVIDHLASQGQSSGRREALPAGAPFGTIKVDESACTLCMACVAVCPTPALASGDGASPALRFREADCIQCGLCEKTCPESAIALETGFLADTEARNAYRTCKEDAAFECIRCGKPFATAGTIANIKTKLADHPYFAGEALKRLEMCEDCRVRDAWRELAKDPNAQLKV